MTDKDLEKAREILKKLPIGVAAVSYQPGWNLIIDRAIETLAQALRDARNEALEEAMRVIDFGVLQAVNFVTANEGRVNQSALHEHAFLVMQLNQLKFTIELLKSEGK